MRISSSDQAQLRQPPSSLRVVTWNVGEVYWPWQGNQLKDRDVEVVIDVLDELDADVVLLQELAHPGQLRSLEAAWTGERAYEGALPERCGYDRQVGLLVRRRLQPRFSEHVLAPSTRAAVEARFQIGDEEARAFSLHFDVFRPARRLEQARTAAAFIGGAGALTIAGGDFNYDPAISSRLGRTLDLATEAALAERLDDVATDSGPTLVGLLRVDRLLAAGSLLMGARSSVSARRLPLGDHAPLLCNLALRTDVEASRRG